MGLRSAGFRVVAGVEIDEIAVKTYRTNHRGVRVWASDARAIDPLRVLEKAGIAPGELDLLGACPPCQGFSSTRTLNGSRSVVDDRNDLVELFSLWVEALKPRAVLFENVPGLRADHRYLRLLGQLERLGYGVASDVLNAVDYGVPQRRRRLVVMGMQGAQVSFAPPSPAVRTVRDAIGGLPEAGASGDPMHDLPERRSDRVKRIIENVPKDGGNRSALPSDLVLACHSNTDGFKDVYGRMAWDRPAPTITGGCFNPSKGRFLHPSEDRAITLREAALLQGFPIGYAFCLDRGKQVAASMIGNALPPPFVEAQASALRAALAKEDA